jgi:hypothetical protein
MIDLLVGPHDTLACIRYREALAELAERSEPSPAGAAAIEHVERCRACADVLGELTLTVVALRRMAAEGDTTWFAWPSIGGPARADADTAWTRLRDRIEHSRRVAREQAWRWRASLGGMLASALVVATLVGPATLGVGAGGVAATSGSDLDVVTWQIEADYLAGAHAIPVTLADPDVAAGTPAVRRYPDNLRPTRKEVAPVRSTGPSPDAR